MAAGDMYQQVSTGRRAQTGDQRNQRWHADKGRNPITKQLTATRTDAATVVLSGDPVPT
jgi:ABC-type xylose transport system substrate-binding protein